jgi:DNA helicase-2/ATP-dependent DNA helicase PcrA
MTRAKDRLFLTSAVRRRIYGTELSNPPSMFLHDIPQELLNAERQPRQATPRRQVYGTLSDESSLKPDTRPMWDGEYRPGTLVQHPEWGLGVVQKKEGAEEDLKLTIIFRDVGRKVVAVKYAKLELADTRRRS